MSETILNMLPLTEEEKAVFEAAAPDAVHLYAGRRTATPEQFAQATVILGWPRPNMVAQAAHLKWFHCMWAGTEEYVDVMPAGAALTSSAGTNSQSVSEHLLASLLALYRKLPLCRDRQREHKWDQDIGSVRTLVGATVLVAGAGHVGSAFAQLCKALGAKRTIGLKRSVNVPVPGFDELFPLSELDRLLPHLHIGSDEPEGLPAHLKRTTMVVLAVTLHNIPEGMAVGVVYAGYLAGTAQITAAGALALSLGIAIQNFPEGAIISMPLRAEGMKKGRAFWGGVLSGIVEPIGAVLTILAAGIVVPALPYLLSFAAGAMLYVVVEELIPEMSQGQHSNVGTVFFAVGFSVMMVLDVALG